jgi:hypothetical protein
VQHKSVAALSITNDECYAWNYLEVFDFITHSDVHVNSAIAHYRFHCFDDCGKAPVVVSQVATFLILSTRLLHLLHRQTLFQVRQQTKATPS